MKRNDTLPALQVCVTTKGDYNEAIPYNGTSITAVTFTMVDEWGNHKVHAQTAQITIYSALTLQYNWQSGDTDTAGKYKGEFEMFFSGGNKLSIPQLGAIDIEITADINEY